MLKVALQELRVPLRRAVRNARGRWHERRMLRVSVRLGEHEAAGEAAPLPGYTRETLEDARRAVEQLRWDGLASLLDAPEALLAEVERRVASPSASFAVGGALLRLAAARTQRSLATIFGQLLGRSPVAFDTAAWVDGDTPQGVVTEARRAVERGHQTLKLKVGVDPEREIAVARALRATFGDAVRLRFDANGQLTGEDGRALLAALRALQPELVEEPGEALFDEAAAQVPVALDESLMRRSPGQVEALLARGVVDALVVKPMALGLHASLAWVRLAARHEATVVVSHLLAGPEEMRVAEALASVVGERAAHGLGHHRVLEALGEPPLPARRRPEVAPCG